MSKTKTKWVEDAAITPPKIGEFSAGSTPEKTAIVSADRVLVDDSENGNAKKYAQAGNLVNDTTHGDLGGSSLHDVATQSVHGFMDSGDKLKLDNIVSNGAGDDWISGLAVTADSPENQTVDYTAGTYLINGQSKEVTPGGNYDLENGFGSVDHYDGLSASQRAVVGIYVDAAEVVKSTMGVAADSGVNPSLPSQITDTVIVAYILISKNGGGVPFSIKNRDITDARVQGPNILLDEMAKVSDNDLYGGYLNGKLVAGDGVSLTELNDGSNETLSISATSAGNLDGGEPDTNYGGTTAIDGGTP